jgi:hypothetical protein
MPFGARDPACEQASSEIAAAFTASRKLELPMVLPMRILQLCSVALGPNSSIILRDKNSSRGRVWLEFLFLRLRASAAELDFGARGVGGFKQSSSLPPYDARNAMPRMVRGGLQ